MPESNRNIYKVAREARGLTQEAAAERLGISDSSIRAYETGQRIPPNDVVDLMVLAYDSQLLGIQHLRASADMARSIVPDVREVDLRTAIMALLVTIYKFVDEHQDRELLRIGADNAVDESEGPEFEEIKEDLGDVIAAAMQVRCAKLTPAE